MVVADATVEPLSPTDSDGGTLYTSEPSTPLTHTTTGQESSNDVPNGVTDVAAKKKKKKKPKKGPKTKENEKSKGQGSTNAESRPPVLCISRNKHWRYISSYHGPWLQLPLELLESLLILNADPTTMATESRMAQLLPPLISNHTNNNSKHRERNGTNPPAEFTPPESPRMSMPSLTSNSFPTPKPGKPSPPPIDPGVFRSVTSIRGLIDEAAELSVRASSGLSAAELGSMRNGASLNGSPWAAAHSLGMNPLGMPNGGGRNVTMSPTRIHRLRALAVQKLAQAYKTDEVASSVMVMQGGSVFDDLAERVLKFDPNDADAKYVHFFHEKIPSRQLAESTTTKVLDELIAKFPQRLEYYRTRGIVHCFREEFTSATKDFTYALKEARAVRRAKMMHHTGNAQSESRPSKSKRRKNTASGNTNGQAPPNGTSDMDSYINGSDYGSGLHPSVLPDAPEPIEPQLLFLRGAAYLQQAIQLIEQAVLGVEEVRKAPTADGAELRLCYIENGKYGGVEIGNPDGPLGPSSGAKVQAYNAVLGECVFKAQITSLLKKSMRDHDKFLSHFDSLESPNAIPEGDIAFQVDYAYALAESKRGSPDIPPVFTSYHPLVVESMFSALICMLMLADFSAILPQFVHTAILVDSLEGYPVFLPPRSMGQAEFMEILERLAGGWRTGTQPHSLSAQRGKNRLALEAPPPILSLPPRAVSLSRTSSFGNTSTTSSLADDYNSIQRASSSSSSSSRKNSFATGAPSTNFAGFDTSSGSATQSTSQLSSSFCSELLEEDMDTSQCPSPEPEPQSPISRRHDATHVLDCARMMLAPVVKRQREKQEKAAMEKANGGKKKPAPINIPLHGPRVEVVLAWLAAVHLPELEG